jgi:hypothetical protein
LLACAYTVDKDDGQAPENALSYGNEKSKLYHKFSAGEVAVLSARY